MRYRTMMLFPVVFVLAVLASGTPAHAQPDCPRNSLCLYDGLNFTGELLILPGGEAESDLDRRDFGDRTSSVFNSSTAPGALYDDTDFKDRKICVFPGTGIANLGSDAYKFNNKASSASAPYTPRCGGGTPGR